MNVEPYPIKTNDYKAPPVKLYTFEAVYAFMMAERKVVIDQVSDIIDEVKSDTNNGYMFDMVDEIEKRVLDLKEVMLNDKRRIET